MSWVTCHVQTSARHRTPVAADARVRSRTKALVALALTCALPAHIEATMNQSQRPAAPAWQQAPDWQEYKALYAAAKRARSPDELDRHDARIRDFTRHVAGLFPRDDNLYSLLVALLFDASNMRSVELHRHIGRARAVDVNQQLAELLPRFERRYQALRALREAGGTDGWLDTALEPLVLHSANAAEDASRRLDMDRPGARDLARRARAFVSEARAWMKASKAGSSR